MKSFAEIAFTPAVQVLQEAHGSRAAYARIAVERGPGEGLSPRETDFLGAADSFYMATVSETGWPYVQHRGGPRGFLKTLSPTCIAFADFAGNRQYVSAGNALREDRVSLIVMDYVNRQRLKLFGRLRFDDIAHADPVVLRAVGIPGYRARIERIAIVDVEAFDWNCPQHITRRFTLEQVEANSQSLHERIAALEAEIVALQSTAGSGAP